MHRFFVPEPIQGDSVVFDSAQSHQMATVLRLRAGDRITAFDGGGGEFEIVLDSVNRSSTGGRIVDRRAGHPQPAIDVTLYQSVLKGDRLDWLVQKTVEVGVGRIVPMVTEHCVARGLTAKRLERLRRIAIEASEQSGRTSVPSIGESITLAEAMETLSIPAMIPWENQADGPVSSVLDRLVPEKAGAIALFIGPEGGFSDAEIAAAAGAGVIPVTLGPRILRSETAAIVALTLVLSREGTLS